MKGEHVFVPTLKPIREVGQHPLSPRPDELTSQSTKAGKSASQVSGYPPLGEGLTQSQVKMEGLAPSNSWVTNDLLRFLQLSQMAS
jgi:hypothetical protein